MKISALVILALAIAQAPSLRDLGADRALAEAECSSTKLGDAIPVAAIGERVSGVKLAAPRWVAATAAVPAYCAVDGTMMPADPSPTAQTINFRVLLPARWTHRAVQLGGGGMNGTIPNLAGNDFPIGGASSLHLGFAKYGSDSGHQAGGFARAATAGPQAESQRAQASPRERSVDPGAPASERVGGSAGAQPPGSDWTLNDEAMKNLGYMQMKKTHDAAMVIMERAYGERPRFNYYTGSSQGGREALTVVQRYPADYDGVIANVPIVNFSSLMLAPELIRIQEKPAANWITRAKINAIRTEFMRQCDSLDGLVDGRINHYAACRAIFDVTQGAPNRHPWVSKRCPNNVDPNPADITAAACLTDGQMATLEFVYRRYRFATPLAHGVTSFGMWLPNTDPGGSGLILDARFRGQEGAAADAPSHTHLGVLGVTGFLMQDLRANPLDYVEGGALNRRRVEISAALDATNPDLSAFARRGGKLIVTIGTNDTLASPGAQLDYYQAVIDTMGQPAVDNLARFFVIPQAGHGLSGASYTTDGDGKAIAAAPIPNAYDRFGVLVDWVEKGTVPAKSLTVTAGEASMPLCSYPMYPRYVSGSPTVATSYTCAR